MWIFRIAREHLQAWLSSPDTDAFLRDLAERSRPQGPVMPMHEHLAGLSPVSPMHQPEWADDTEWKDER